MPLKPTARPVPKKRRRLDPTLPLAALLRLAGVELSRKGSVGRCPLHEKERLTGEALQPQPPDR